MTLQEAVDVMGEVAKLSESLQSFTKTSDKAVEAAVELTIHAIEARLWKRERDEARAVAEGYRSEVIGYEKLAGLGLAYSKPLPWGKK